MSVEFTFRGRAVEDGESIVEEITKDLIPSTEAMLFAGSRQITRIRERTEQGIDVNGQEFQEYSEAYAKRREKLGRNVEPVDLTMSGRLLTSLQVEVEDANTFVINSQDAEAAIYGQAINDGLGNQPERRFFDTSDDELGAMQSDLFGFDKASGRS